MKQVERKDDTLLDDAAQQLGRSNYILRNLWVRQDSKYNSSNCSIDQDM